MSIHRTKNQVPLLLSHINNSNSPASQPGFIKPLWARPHAKLSIQHERGSPHLDHEDKHQKVAVAQNSRVMGQDILMALWCH